MNDDRAEEIATPFATTLARLREAQHLNKKELARLIDFDPSYVSHMENGRHRPTYEFAARADAVLRADGELIAAFDEFCASSNRHSRAVPADRYFSAGMSPGLVVRSEQAHLTRSDDGFYQITIQRELHNGTGQPVTRFPVRIEVDAHPTDSSQSRLFYRNNPVTLDEIDFQATFNGEPTTWDVLHDRDAYKKIYIRFEPHGLLKPVYPGESAIVNCEYRVPLTKWGDWFEREVRWPTERLSVSLNFPERLGVRLTAREVTWSGDRVLPTEIKSWILDGVRYYSWSTARPALTNQYRFDWKIISPLFEHASSREPVAGRR
ncbi:helix-turn-helix transcriptional regulator [Actinoplanes sp. NPDC049118]|uniref:helix-turn-helix domain-containing protein n=1 Tax=Actinoplanes sp. NPDC049118 TaxID=3155769 RepID=UPI0033D5CFF5